ncbi:hypothetical protein [uncultured Friedmanniella sp.]|uniref:hypothetical protein n=1 Tax=uncultured Friedmanniella sp. TaxID=335381 RepID=UPI0035CB3977
MSEDRVATLARAAAMGVAAGLVGVAAMTASEKVEQAVTHRRNSYVPARALLTALGQQPGDSDRPAGWNYAMHWGTGAVLGALRGVWAVTGMRGPAMNAWHTVARLNFDQTVENVTGVGAPPTTWPTGEQVIDVLHKAVYATVTGVVADRWIAPVLQSARGRHSH